MHIGAMAAVRELGYWLGSQHCRECRPPGGSGLIGVLPADLGNPCRTDVIARIEAEAKAEADSPGPTGRDRSLPNRSSAVTFLAAEQHSPYVRYRHPKAAIGPRSPGPNPFEEGTP